MESMDSLASIEVFGKARLWGPWALGRGTGGLCNSRGRCSGLAFAVTSESLATLRSIATSYKFTTLLILQ